MSSPLTTHVLDTARGLPAVGLHVRLERLDDADGWVAVARGTTDADGRVKNLLPAEAFAAATWRLAFETGEWFEAQGQPAFFPLVEVTFTVDDPTRHHHVPLLLSPYGYSTYRGS